MTDCPPESRTVPFTVFKDLEAEVCCSGACATAFRIRLILLFMMVASVPVPRNTIFNTSRTSVSATDKDTFRDLSTAPSRYTNIYPVAFSMDLRTCSTVSFSTVMVTLRFCAKSPCDVIATNRKIAQNPFNKVGCFVCISC